MGTKISALTAVTALTGTESVAIVQGGTTVRTTVNDFLTLLLGSTALTSKVNALIAAAGGGTTTPPSIAISAAVSHSEGNSGTTTFAYTLTLTRNGNTSALPFTWSVAGSGSNPADAADFGGTFPSGSGTFAAGETSKTITVLATGDTAVEPDETFTFSATLTGYNTVTASGTIVNDDTATNAIPLASNLAVHWDIEALAVQADNTGVAGWTDSVAGIAAIQASSGSQPLYRTNRSANGKPSLQCSAGRWLDAGRAQAILDSLGDSKAALVLVFRNAGASRGSYGTIVGFSPGYAGGMYTPHTSSAGCGSSNNICPAGRMLGYNDGLQVLVLTKFYQRVYINGSMVAQVDLTSGENGSGHFRIGAQGTDDDYWQAMGIEVHDILMFKGVDIANCDALAITKWAHTKYGEAMPWAGVTDFWAHDGDSTVYGIGANYGYSMPAQVALNYNRKIGTWTNVGKSGLKMSDMIASGPVDLDAITSITGKTLKLFAYELTNRCAPPVANLVAEDKQYLAARKAAQPTCKIAFGNSIGIYADTTDGTTLSETGTTRIAYKNAVNGYTSADGVDALVDTFSNPNIGAINSCPYGASFPTQYWHDNVPGHPIDAGYAVFAGIVGPVMAAL